MWEFVFNPPEHAGWAVNVTAKCSECGEAMFDNPAVLGWNNRENGTVLWSGFITNYRGNEERAKLFAFECAEYGRAKLPKYCARCGMRMDGGEGS